MTVEDLNQHIIWLHRNGAMHVRRGFSLKDAKAEHATVHLLEEAVEFQAEVMWGNFPSQIEEAADVLCVLLHALWLAGVPLENVVVKAREKMAETFTLDESKVTAVKPGMSRRARP